MSLWIKLHIYQLKQIPSDACRFLIFFQIFYSSACTATNTDWHLPTTEVSYHLWHWSWLRAQVPGVVQRNLSFTWACIVYALMWCRKKQVSTFERRREIISLYVWAIFSLWHGSKQKTEKDIKNFRMTMCFIYFKTVIVFTFIIASSEQFPMQRKLVCAKHYFMLPIVYCLFFHRSLPLCWLTASYSPPSPCPLGMRRNSCGLQALKIFSPRPHHSSMINKVCRNNSEAHQHSTLHLNPKLWCSAANQNLYHALKSQPHTFTHTALHNCTHEIAL